GGNDTPGVSRGRSFRPPSAFRLPPYVSSLIPRPSSLVAPYVAGDLDHELELAPLVVVTEEVAVVAARETALRAHAQVLEGDVARGVVDPPHEIVLALQHRRLRRNQSQHDFLASGNQSQGLETARPRGVEFEEVAIHVRLVEHRFSDRL